MHPFGHFRKWQLYERALIDPAELFLSDHPIHTAHSLSTRHSGAYTCLPCCSSSHSSSLRLHISISLYILCRHLTASTALHTPKHLAIPPTCIPVV
jgi:hypothetical protein